MKIELTEAELKTIRRQFPDKPSSLTFPSVRELIEKLDAILLAVQVERGRSSVVEWDAQ